MAYRLARRLPWRLPDMQASRDLHSWRRDIKYHAQKTRQYHVLPTRVGGNGAAGSALPATPAKPCSTGAMYTAICCVDDYVSHV